MRKRVAAVVALLAIGLVTVGVVTPALAASQRQNDSLEVWCDSDTHNADGATIELKVLTPDVFKCKKTTATGVAIAAYNLTKTQDDALAIANAANVVAAVGSMVPI